MARGIIEKGGSPTSRVLDFEKCDLLSELTPEQLYTLARHSITHDLDSFKSINSSTLIGRVVFVIDGEFEEIYYQNEASREDPSKAVVLHSLYAGDIWGESSIVSSAEASESSRLGLRARGNGKIISILGKRFARFVDMWPQLQKALLKYSLNKETEQGLRLGAVQYQLSRTDVVLERIESVADIVMGMNEQEQSDSVQTKFLLHSLPDLKKIACKEMNLEQAYLKSSGSREDRIRKEGDDKFTRTSKFGVGIKRREFKREISASEYEHLSEVKEGRWIRKKRYQFKDSATNGVVINIDEFFGDGDLKGLLLLEFDFSNIEDVKNYTAPEWLEQYLGEEVTSNEGYKNHSLALHGNPGK